MVLYIVRCKSLHEASEIQSRMIALCPTLIYTRILNKVHDLDFYNSDVIQAGDESFPIGSLVLTPNAFSAQKKDFPLFVVIALTLFAATVIAVRVFSFARPSLVGMAVVSGILALGLGLFVYLNFRLIGSFSSEHKVFAKTENWLRKGFPIVLAASEEGVDERCLPKGTFRIYRASHVNQRKAA